MTGTAENNTTIASKQVRRAELIISLVLRIGVALSLLFIVSGVALSIVRNSGDLASSAALNRFQHPQASFPHTLSSIAAGARALQGRALIALGLLLLILTPVARVGASIGIFIAGRDRLYTLITVIVFAILLLSFVVGRSG